MLILYYIRIGHTKLAPDRKFGLEKCNEMYVGIEFTRIQEIGRRYSLELNEVNFNQSFYATCCETSVGKF